MMNVDGKKIIRCRYMWINEIRNRHIIVFGAGSAGNAIVYLLKRQGITIDTCFDNNPTKIGEELWGVKIAKPYICNGNPVIVICLKDESRLLGIKEQCLSLGYRDFLIIEWKELTECIDALPDKECLELLWKDRKGEYLDLEHPKTFNEKIQWLKLYDRNPLYHVLVDKIEVKAWVENLIGKEYVIPTIAVYNNPEEIDFEELPNQFVLKCNHNSGVGMYICSDKTRLDREKVKEELKKGLAQNWYLPYREWAYKGIKPRIIAEQYLCAPNGLNDYKVFNSYGKPIIIQVDFDRFTNHKRNLYTPQWDYIEAEIEFPSDPEHQIEKPDNLDELLELSSILTRDIPQARADFYIVDGQIFFGEITLYHGAGYEDFRPRSFEQEFGKCFPIPIDKRRN